MSRASGAPPETAQTSRPPSAAWSFEKTSLWATLRLNSRPARTGWPRCWWRLTSRPAGAAPREILGERGREAVRHAQERLEPGEGVGERQEQEVDPAVLHRRRLHGGVHGGDVVSVSLHDALGRAGRARGVDDRREVVGLRRA